MSTANADWCESDDDLIICGTRMIEDMRESLGFRWCFTCRRRHEFWWVLMVPDGFSYYEPSWGVDGLYDGCSDLFPGWVRVRGDET